jgi:hypothetical protein
MLKVLAKTGPATIAVDDVQWVDEPSARTLTFALPRGRADHRRRGEAAGGGIGRATRPRAQPPSRVERITLGPLDEASHGRLLRRHPDRAFPPPLVKKIHKQTAGNPFFAIELARTLGGEAPTLQPGEPLPVPRDLESLLNRRVSALSGAAHTASLLIAASSAPSHDVVEAAGGSAAGIQDAVDEGIVAVHGTRL